MNGGQPGPVLRVEPPLSPVDRPLEVTVSGLAPGAAVTLRAAATDGAARRWASWARFRADDRGHVDVAARAPVAGTYQGIDPLGLLWSMQPPEPTRPVFFQLRGADPVEVTVVAETGDGPAGSATVQRAFAGPDVTSRPVPAPGIVGTLWHPGGGGPYPGVVLLGGSDGGPLDHAAALLAGHGHAVLSLRYFGVAGRPPALLDIDLEYFDEALRWLLAQPEVAGTRLSLVGLSRGGELALQLGAVFPIVAAVVAGSPAGIRHAGLPPDYADFTRPAWRYRGEPLPFLPGRRTPGSAVRFFAAWTLRRPFRQRSMFERALRDRDQVERASIEVERIDGPVLLISGGRDALWPADRFGDDVLRRLRVHGHRYPVRHLRYADAGHFVCFPYGLPSLPPMTRLGVHPRLTIDFGGTAAANAAASRESWAEILGFLADAAGG
jgi:dienelactone hydrolase